MSSFRDRMREYEGTMGKRVGRLAITIDQGTVSQLGITARAMKWYLRGLCAFLVVTSIIVLATGSYADSSNDSIQSLGSDFINIVYMIGAFLLVMGVFGLCGSVRESRLLLFVFAFLMIIMFILILILAAVTLSYIGQEGRIVNRFWQVASVDERFTIQNNWFCCGANFNPCIDTTTGKYYPQQNDCDKITPPGGVPNSQTIYQGQLPAFPCPPQAGSVIGGCTPPLVASLKKAATGFGVAGMFIAALCLTGVLSTCCLLSGIRASEEQKAAVAKKSKAAGRV